MEIAPNSDDEAKQHQKNGHLAKSIGEMKASAKSKYQQRADTTDSVALPQPTFREVPANVNANHVRSERAEPAPRSQPSAPQVRTRKKQTSKKPGGIGGGDGESGSDSDGGGGRKRGGGSPSQPSRRPKAQSPPDSMEPIPGDASLNAEEEKRLQAQRALNRFEPDWVDRLRYRSQKRAEGEQRRRLLATNSGEARPDSRLLASVREYDKFLEDYLDDSLLAAIGIDWSEDVHYQTPSLNVKTNLILSAEEDVIRILRSRNLRSYQDDAFYSSNPSQLAALPADTNHPVERMHSHIAYLRSESRFNGIETREDMLDWILLNEAPDYNLFQYIGPEYNLFRSIAYAYLGEIAEQVVNDIKNPSQAGLPFLTTLQKSRDGGNLLNREYIEWVWSRCDAAMLKEVLLRDKGYERQCKKEHIRRYRESMRDVHVSQEFVMVNTSSSNTVGMTILMNGRALTLKMVYGKDLVRMGWRRQADGDYWRGAIFKDQPELVFQVNMDGEVLDLVESLDWYRAVVG
ncbi:hypothetical protein PGQ11_013434 [Apiospora arundinis]|uniref:Uncharacterized protein n=1 Tax=Apiospora arundinis TaxID=335852 RepID=A0ABR2HPB4_9PEZI